MKIKNTLPLLTFVLVSLWLAGCKKDKDQVELPPAVLNSPELITSMVLQFRDSADVTNLKTFAYRDPDGPGGNNATVHDTIRLKSNTTYYLEVVMLDETKMPMDTISKEILKEKEAHQFFFKLSNNFPVTIQYQDLDGNGLPVGLKTKWRMGIQASGTCQIILKHQEGTKNGTEGPGETDADVTFISQIN